MVLGFAFTVYAARHLGTAGYGQYTLAFSYLVIFQALSQFGLGELLVRRSRGALPPLPDLLQPGR